MLCNPSDLFIVTTSWDDGDPLDLRVAEIMEEHNVQGTFYIPPKNRERSVIKTSDLRELSCSFEIGGHTLNHLSLTGLSSELIDKEISGGKAVLEDAIGDAIEVFCYPKGHFDKRVIETVVRAGFKGARTTEIFSLDPGREPFRMPTTIQIFPKPPWIHIRHLIKTFDVKTLQKYVEMGIRNRWSELGKLFFEEFLIKGGVFHLWGHSWEIDQFGLWQDLRKIIKYISGHNNVLYLTNGETVSEIYYKKILGKL